MDSIEPEQTPFAAVSAQTSKFQRVSGACRTETSFKIGAFVEDGIADDVLL